MDAASINQSFWCFWHQSSSHRTAYAKKLSILGESKVTRAFASQETWLKGKSVPRSRPVTSKTSHFRRLQLLPEEVAPATCDWYCRLGRHISSPQLIVQAALHDQILRQDLTHWQQFSSSPDRCQSCNEFKSSTRKHISCAAKSSILFGVLEAQQGTKTDESYFCFTYTPSPPNPRLGLRLPCTCRK